MKSALFSLGEGGNWRLRRYDGQTVTVVEDRQESPWVLVEAGDGHLFSVLPGELIVE